jgi:hypothetical protein
MGSALGLRISFGRTAWLKVKVSHKREGFRIGECFSVGFRPRAVLLLACGRDGRHCAVVCEALSGATPKAGGDGRTVAGLWEACLCDGRTCGGQPTTAAQYCR